MGKGDQRRGDERGGKEELEKKEGKRNLNINLIAEHLSLDFPIARKFRKIIKI